MSEAPCGEARCRYKLTSTNTLREQIIWRKYAEMQDFTNWLKLGNTRQTSWRRRVLKIGREYTSPRDAPRTERNGATGANTRIGPIHDMLITEPFGRYGIEVEIDSLEKDG